MLNDSPPRVVTVERKPAAFLFDVTLDCAQTQDGKIAFRQDAVIYA